MPPGGTSRESQRRALYGTSSSVFSSQPKFCVGVSSQYWTSAFMPAEIGDVARPSGGVEIAQLGVAAKSPPAVVQNVLG